jgi:hypothetical protein
MDINLPQSDDTSQVPTQEPPKPEDDLTGLKSALATERARAKAAEDRLKGVDLAEYDRLKKLEETTKAAAETARKNQLAEQGKYKELLAEKDNQLTAAQNEALAAKQEARATALRSDLARAFVSADGIGEQLENFVLIAQSRLKTGEDGSIIYPGDAIKKDGSPINSMSEFAVWLRESGGVGFAFAPLNKANGTNLTTTTTSNPAKPKTVSPSEAYKYLEEIRMGEITIEMS